MRPRERIPWPFFWGLIYRSQHTARREQRFPRRSARCPIYLSKGVGLILSDSEGADVACRARHRQNDSHPAASIALTAIGGATTVAGARHGARVVSAARQPVPQSVLRCARSGRLAAPESAGVAEHQAGLVDVDLQDRSYVDEELEASQSDLLFEVQWQAGDGQAGAGQAGAGAAGSEPQRLLLYVLFEHQSTPNRWMRFRLLEYCCRIWRMPCLADKKRRELPRSCRWCSTRVTGAGGMRGSSGVIRGGGTGVAVDATL